VHLAGEADAGNVIRREVRAGESFANREGAGAPPVLRMLFSPSDLRRGERRVLFSCGREYAALFVDDEGARAAGAYVNA
jgi:hypothetical protein